MRLNASSTTRAILSGFNPLFIGSKDATPLLRPFLYYLHRFNPLFIGSKDATGIAPSAQRRRRKFQSPFHRVKGCDRMVLRKEGSEHDLFQSPFHRVKGCDRPYGTEIACAATDPGMSQRCNHGLGPKILRLHENALDLRRYLQESRKQFSRYSLIRHVYPTTEGQCQYPEATRDLYF